MQRKDGFIFRIKIKDRTGRVVGHVDAVSFKGLLSVAHDEGLTAVETTVVQLPTEENGRAAVVRATVTTRKGTFTATGDANPENVDAKIAPHVLRMAETRAIARAFRLAINVGEVAIEELSETAPDDPPVKAATPTDRHAPEHAPAESDTAPPTRFRGRDDRPTEADAGDRRAMSEEQRKLLFRLVFDLGETRETARDRVLKALGVERLEWATRVDASRAIDTLKREAAHRTNGHGANGEAGHGA